MVKAYVADWKKDEVSQLLPPSLQRLSTTSGIGFARCPTVKHVTITFKHITMVTQRSINAERME